MKAKKELLRRVRQGCYSVALLSAFMTSFSSCEKYDLDEKDPEGWGASIYNYLEEAGNFKNTTRLIDDLKLKDVLAKTGSKTLFAANDEAFDRFYSNNTWGVKSYEELSESQKKLLLYGSMINNSYQVNDLSSIENRVEGMCMRRLSSQTVLDTVARVPWDRLPNMKPGDEKHNKLWQKFYGRGNVVLMTDMTTSPMLHFIEKQMANNKITNDDYDFLYNHTTQRKSGDASVNGIQIEKQNIKCSNGFIHEMADVIMPLQNMAEVIAQHEELSEYNRLLERFCAPFWVGKEMTEQYNYMYGTNVDSVFQKRFFSLKSQKGAPLLVDDYENVFSESNDVLTFDPEWNTYFTGSATTSQEERMKADMAVMLVPSNKALDEFWNADKGPGKVLRGQYPDGINSVPNKVISKLLNNNMLVSFINSVPSKFDNVLNNNNDPMGLKAEYIDKVYLANNGAIYVTNKVFSPTEYVSVLYPTTVNETMSIYDWAINQNEYNVYLNSLQAYYSLFIHTNKTLDYVDPLSILHGSPKIYRFHYSASRKNSDGNAAPVYASIHPYNLETKEIGDSIDFDENTSHLALRLRDILDASIVVNESVEDGHKYYRTMGYQEIIVENGGKSNMTVQGGRQINEENGHKLNIQTIYDQSKNEAEGKDGNGKCYVLDGSEPIMGTFKTVIETLEEHEEMSVMADLLRGSGILETQHGKKYWALGENISTFNTYHYTVYVPTNSSIRQWLSSKGIPDGWDSIDKMPYGDKRTEDSLAIVDFVKYHIQDNALFIGAAAQAQKQYGTSLIKNDQFQKLTATLTDNSIEVKGNKNETSRKVMTSTGLYNLIAREYLFEQEWNNDGAKTKLDCNKLFTTSSAVIHLIDGPLIYK